MRTVANTISKSVQFRRPALVIAAYKARNVAPFAVWCNKQFLFKYEGNDIDEGVSYLESFLKMLEDSKSATTYTLCVYENPPGGKINSNIPFDGSYNFRFQDEYYRQDAMEIARTDNAVVTELNRRMELLQQQISALHDYIENKPDEEPEAVGAAHLMKMIEPVLPQIAERLINIFLPAAPANTSPSNNQTFEQWPKAV